VRAPARKPTVWEAVAPLVAAAAVVGMGIIFFRDTVSVPILLALSCIAPAVVSLRLGLDWRSIEDGMVHGMQLALQACVILLVVGTTIGAWAQCGTIASMVYYGLEVLSPSWFLPASCVICLIVSTSIGSSWTTAATVGVALMGIGGALGVPPPMTAGAVLSGAYFGDKMSPLSDTTNLAPSIAGSELFEHIRAMMYTTLPALVLALIGFTVLGILETRDAAGYDPGLVAALRDGLASSQHVSPWLLLPPVIVIGLAVARVPAVPALMAATFLGGLAGWIAQDVTLGGWLQVLYDGYTSQTGNALVDDLLSRGGMSSMLDTIALILCATAFGGIMERAGFIETLLQVLLKRVRSAGGLVTATVVSCVGSNFLLCDQYLAIVLPGRMYREAYPAFGLQRRMLSRTLEDGGTVTSCLCPWNSGGAFMSATLGVATLSYVPYAFLNLLVPTIAVLFALTGSFILRVPGRDAGGPEIQRPGQN